ncbi:hypothetical protein STEG23_032692, partial [Scotinomys teguina]
MGRKGSVKTIEKIIDKILDVGGRPLLDYTSFVPDSVPYRLPKQAKQLISNKINKNLQQIPSMLPEKTWDYLQHYSSAPVAYLEHLRAFKNANPKSHNGIGYLEIIILFIYVIQKSECLEERAVNVENRFSTYGSRLLQGSNKQQYHKDQQRPPESTDTYINIHNDTVTIKELMEIMGYYHMLSLLDEGSLMTIGIGTNLISGDGQFKIHITIDKSLSWSHPHSYSWVLQFSQDVLPGSVAAIGILMQIALNLLSPNLSHIATSSKSRTLKYEICTQVNGTRKQFLIEVTQTQKDKL